MKSLLAILLLLSIPTLAAHRSSKARYQFRKSHPCPATGLTRGACRGYVIDHVVPLCANGADDPLNMQWQTVSEAKRKDVLEKRQCAKVRRGDLYREWEQLKREVGYEYIYWAQKFAAPPIYPPIDIR